MTTPPPSHDVEISAYLFLCGMMFGMIVFYKLLLPCPPCPRAGRGGDGGSVYVSANAQVGQAIPGAGGAGSSWPDDAEYYGEKDPCKK